MEGVKKKEVLNIKVLRAENQGPLGVSQTRRNSKGGGSRRNFKEKRRLKKVNAQQNASQQRRSS